MSAEIGNKKLERTTNSSSRPRISGSRFFIPASVARRLMMVVRRGNEMVEFEDFLTVALTMGTGRMIGTERQMPVFVPEGNYQDELFEKAIDYLSKGGFILLDVRNISYETAISTLKLDWPTLVDKWPRDEFKANIIESESRLLIVCGKESHPRFWKFLCGESLLYTGSVLPPIRDISPRCFVISDRASVAALIKHRDFYDNYPLEFFGPVGTFNSNTVPFTL